MSIYVTGDIHGNPSRLSTAIFPEQKEMTKEDFLIILGDFGLVWDYRGENKNEKYWLDWLETKSFTTLFIDGNHDNFSRLNSYETSEFYGGKCNFIRPSVIHLKRGQVFNLQGKKFFTFGGAKSHDISDGILEPGDPRIKKWNKDYNKMCRINGVSWWKEELPSQEEMDEGIHNLSKENNKVDYILTHCPPTYILKQMDGVSGLYQSDILSDYLQTIKENVEYKKWLFGHMHVNENYSWENAVGLYEQIVRIL